MATTAETIPCPCDRCSDGATMTVAQARTVRARLNRLDSSGRPKELRPCPACRKKFGARELREHWPQCSKRQR